MLPSLDRRDRRKTRADEFAAALLSGEAWDRWCDGLKAAGRAVLDSPDAVSDTDRAEGFRYLMGLAYQLMVGELYETDARAPAFTLTASDVVKWGLDNPDATLLSAPLSDDGVFRVYGSARSVRMVEFVISNSGRPVIRQLDEFERGADGSFSILLAKSPQPGNWIQLPEGAAALLVRRAFYDWDVEEVPHVAIQRVDAAPDVLARCLRTPTAADVGEQLDAMAVLVEQHAAYWIAMVHSFRSDGDNVIAPPRPLPSTGMNSSRSSVKGFFVLEPDQALVVTFRPPEGSFWSICLGDIWFRTIEYSHHQTSLNGHQAPSTLTGCAGSSFAMPTQVWRTGWTRSAIREGSCVCAGSIPTGARSPKPRSLPTASLTVYCQATPRESPRRSGQRQWVDGDRQSPADGVSR